MINYIEKKVCLWLIKRLHKGYGGPCKTYDLDDLKDKSLNVYGRETRCAACEANDVMKWLKGHVELLEDY